MLDETGFYVPSMAHNALPGVHAGAFLVTRA